jgi:hypothetical protein
MAIKQLGMLWAAVNEPPPLAMQPGAGLESQLSVQYPPLQTLNSPQS